MRNFTLFFVALLSITLSPSALYATEIEPTLKPRSTYPDRDRPFMAPLDEVGFMFDRCIKLFDGATVTISCDGETVATSTDLEIDNYEGEKSKQGTLIAKFEKQNLPKGKTYTISLSKGAIGWVECYSDIQIVNPAYSFDVSIPDNLGTPTTYMEDDSPAFDSESNALVFRYLGIEIAPVDSPKFLFYREGELVDEIPAIVSWDWGIGDVRPQFPEKINFDFGVRYSLVLPAGSVSAMYREDIVNEEHSLNFIGVYEPEDAPFSYSWCSLFTDHSDVLNEVSFTYRSPVGVAEDAVIELYEGDCETLVKSAPAYLNTDANCWLVCCDFGGFKMSSEKGYTIIIPDDAVYLQEFPDIKATGGKVKVSGTAGIDGAGLQPTNDSPIYDLYGRKVANPVAGQLYIQDGRKFIFRK